MAVPLVVVAKPTVDVPLVPPKRLIVIVANPVGMFLATWKLAVLKLMELSVLTIVSTAFVWSPKPAGELGLANARLTVLLVVITQSSIIGTKTCCSTSPGGKITFVTTDE